MNTFEIKKGYFKVYDGRTAYDLHVDEGRDYGNLPDPEYIYKKGIAAGLPGDKIIDLMLRLIHRKRVFKGDWLGDLSLCVAFVGPRGSGKSVGMTGVSILDGLLAGRRVVSNMPIAVKVRYRDAEKVFQTEDLDAVSMLDVNEFDENYFDCMVAVDEVNVYLADSQRTNTNQALFFSYILQQMRHRQLDFVFTTQNETWMTNRMRFQIDFYISCRDYAMLNGKPKKEDIGRKSRWNIHDMSGLVTGEVLHSNRTNFTVPAYTEKIFWNVPFWNCFSTELMQKREKFSLSNNTANNSLQFDPSRIELIQSAYDVPIRMVTTIINRGFDRCSKANIWDILGISGDKSMQTKLGKIFNDIGCRTVNKKDYIFPTQADMVKNLAKLGIEIKDGEVNDI